MSAPHTYYPPPPRPSPGVEQLLLEPDWPVKAAGGYVAHALAGGAQLLVPAVLCVLAAVVGVIVVRWVHQRGFAREARLVRIGVPPEVQEKGGQLGPHFTIFCARPFCAGCWGSRISPGRSPRARPARRSGCGCRR